MSAQYTSKHGLVQKPPYELYMQFCDMNNFRSMLPEDKKQGVTADYDSLNVTVQNFSIGIKVVGREPYSLLEFADNGAPFHFNVKVFFDKVEDALHTDFHIEAQADINLMMKTFLGPKIQKALDMVVDGIVAVSEGRMPEGMDPSQFPAGFKF